MSISIISGSGNAAVLTVDSTSNAARITPYDTSGNAMVAVRGANLPTSPAGLPIGGINDGAWRVARFDRYGNIRAGFDTMLLHDDIEGTTLNAQMWTTTAATATVTQTTVNGILLNGGASVTINQGVMIQSQKQFFKMQQMPMRLRMRVRPIFNTGVLLEFGFSNVAAVATIQHTTGAIWRYKNDTGFVTPVIMFNGADVVTGTNIASLLNMTTTNPNYYSFEIIVDDDQVGFICQDVSTGRSISEQWLNIPITQAKMWSATHLPVFARVFNVAAPSVTAGQLYISDVLLIGYDTFMNKPWQHLQAARTKGQETIPTSFLQTHQWANSAAATSVTFTNTTSPAGSVTLGGTNAFTTGTAWAANTDFIIYSYPVVSPYTFYCTGVHISFIQAGATSATTPNTFGYFLSSNNVAITLAGKTAAIPCGVQSIPVGSVVGYCAPDIDINFDVPLKTEPGRFMQLGARAYAYTATASQLLTWNVTFKGYFE